MQINQNEIPVTKLHAEEASLLVFKDLESPHHMLIKGVFLNLLSKVVAFLLVGPLPQQLISIDIRLFEEVEVSF